TAYLLMGLTFAMLYQFIHKIDPAGSFQAQPGIHGEDHVFTWSDFIYFSFISLTTVGYGDIIPTNSFTRGLAVLESIAGVLYVAVLIAQLAIFRRTDGGQTTL
ncbi:MAG: potassium channel family protein, partial [Phycisphaerales bacterium]|nr:potassium channel family protein [Phycisphaerales bacterium]